MLKNMNILTFPSIVGANGESQTSRSPGLSSSPPYVFPVAQ